MVLGGKYFINNAGEVFDKNKTLVSFTKDTDGNRVVTCCGWNGEGEYRVIDRRQVYLDTGWQLKLSSQEWEEVTEPEEKIYKSHTELMAKDIRTNETIIASSDVELSLRIGIKELDIIRASYTHGNMIVGDFRIRRGISSEKWPTVN